MPSKVFSAAVIGLDAQVVEVETDVSYGLRFFNIVGLGDQAVQESKERIGSAIKSIKFSSPHNQPLRVLVNLAPADLKKEGSLYDLPIAVGFLLASKQLKFDPSKKVFVGELALDGKLRPVKGVLAISLMARDKGFKEIILPKNNAFEAALIKDVKVIGLDSLKEVIDYLEGRKAVDSFDVKAENFLENPEYQTDIGWIKGQEYAKRALEIAAAGSHNLFMEGPPGAGKTLLAKAMPTILPKLSLDESLEVTKIYSVSGLLSENKPLINIRPFRSPHHTSSEVALIGGGNPPRPGEITLAHRGILFLDEFPEFHRDVLESLRQPIEEGNITISRARNFLTFPARFTLLAATNPCPCGYFNDPERKCTCMPSQISMYRRKLSGPLMDRMDLFINVPALKFEKLTAEGGDFASEKVRKKVEDARFIQKERFTRQNFAKQNLGGFKEEKILTNSEMNIPQIKKYCQVDIRSQDLLRKYVNSGKCSARGYHRVLKVARTISDLENSTDIKFEHVAEALMYRTKEDK